MPRPEIGGQRLHGEIAMSKSPKAVIFGLSGLSLTEAETAFFKDTKPLGYILFRRNVETPEQVKALVDALKALHSYEVLILIDQEGGRVRRLRPPHWPDYPAANTYGEMAGSPDHHRDFVRLGARLMAEDLFALGINVDCAPVLDVPQPGAHDIIGDRAFGQTSESVARLGRAVCEGLLAGGVLPIIKHIPGHGRANADSHVDLPRVTVDLEALETDFYPFRVNADMPIAMTAHVLYEALDKKHTATTSKKVVRFMRDNIGFDGVILCDDLSMQALSGTLAERAEAAIAAGCDVLLHCNGEMKDMVEIAEVTPKLQRKAKARIEAAWARLVRTPEPLGAGDRDRFGRAVAALRNRESVVDPTEVLTKA